MVRRMGWLASVARRGGRGGSPHPLSSLSPSAPPPQSLTFLLIIHTSPPQVYLYKPTSTNPYTYHKVLVAAYMQMFLCKNITSLALKYGRKYENIASSKYEELLAVQVQPTGLTLMPSHPYIAASGDGLVGKTVIEIKCHYSGKEGTIEELVANGYSHIVQQNGKWHINKSSPYYCQIQGYSDKKLYSMPLCCMDHA